MFVFTNDEIEFGWSHKPYGYYFPISHNKIIKQLNLIEIPSSLRILDLRGYKGLLFESTFHVLPRTLEKIYIAKYDINFQSKPLSTMQHNLKSVITYLFTNYPTIKVKIMSLSVLGYSVLYNDDDLLQLSLKNVYQLSTMERRYRGETVLHYAIHKDDYDLVVLLYNHGADINSISKRENKTPVEIAFNRLSDQILYFLLDHGGKYSKSEKTVMICLSLSIRLQPLFSRVFKDILLEELCVWLTLCTTDSFSNSLDLVVTYITQHNCVTSWMIGLLSNFTEFDRFFIQLINHASVDELNKVYHFFLHTSSKKNRYFLI